MNIQQIDTQQHQQHQQQVFLSNENVTNLTNQNNQNIILTNTNTNGLQTSSGFYLIQQQPHQQNQNQNQNQQQQTQPQSQSSQFILASNNQLINTNSNQTQFSLKQTQQPQQPQQQIQFITTQQQQQPQMILQPAQNQQLNNIKYITTTNNSSNQQFIQNVQNTPRIIIQQSVNQQFQQQNQQQPTTYILQPQQTNSNSNQIFLNINNRIVPIQSLNVKPQQQPQQQDQQPQYMVISNQNQTQSQPSNLGAEIAEKMKQLEQIQNHLRQYQQKILASSANTNSDTQTPQTLTQHQIQAVLTPNEQTQLQKLLLQKKSVESEIQQLKQKLLAPTDSNKVTPVPVQTQPQSSINKLQLLQQVNQKLSSLRASKTVTIDAATGQQQLVLTHDEFDQMKKLIDLQNQLQNELKNSASTITTATGSDSTASKAVTVQQKQPQITTTIKLNELSLTEKYKLNDIIKNQIEQIKQSLIKHQELSLSVQQQQQFKDKYLMLVKKQSEIQSLIDRQEKETSTTTTTSTPTSSTSISTASIKTVQSSSQIVNVLNQTNVNTTVIKQTPIKIRNVISSSSSQSSPSAPSITVLKSVPQQQTPLRTLVINNKDNTPVLTTTTTTSTTNPINPATLGILPIQHAINLHKQNFPHVNFRCLNFEELAQHAVITKDTDELTFNLLRQLDDRAAQVINRDQLESFTKNQVKLVKKYLEQQLFAKQNVRNRINEQLCKDQKLATEPDFRNKFTDKTDAIKRLSRYHVFQKTCFEPSEQESEKFDNCFEEVSERLLKIADAMKKRFNLLQLRSMQKEVVSSEETMLLKLYVDDLKQNIEQEKTTTKEKQAHVIKHERAEQKPINIIQTDSPQTIRKLIQISQANSLNNINNTASNSNDFVLNTSLKRVFKHDNIENNENNDNHTNSNKILKLEPSTSHLSSSSSFTQSSESSTSIKSMYNSNINNQSLTSSAYPSSSGSFMSSQNQNQTFSLSAQNLLDEHVNDDLMLDFDDNQSTNQSNDDSLLGSNNNHLVHLNTNQTNSFINEQFSMFGTSNNNRLAGTNGNLSNVDNYEDDDDDDAEEEDDDEDNLSGLDDLMLNEDDLAVQSILDF